MKFLVKVGVVLGIFALIVLVLILIDDKIDDCLDAGGRWNHETELCEYE